MWLQWPQLNPRIPWWGGRGGGNGCSLKEALSLTGGREKALESRRGVLNSASRGTSPVMGGWRGQARKSRAAGGVAWLKSRPSRLSDLNDSNGNAFATTGTTSGL